MRDLACEEVLELLMDFLKREVPPEIADQVRRHLDTCRPCEKHAHFEARFVFLVEQRLGGGSAPDHLKHRIIDALKDRSG
jgi:anti-sigma factor (TIGR02949 family)